MSLVRVVARPTRIAERIAEGPSQLQTNRPQPTHPIQRNPSDRLGSHPFATSSAGFRFRRRKAWRFESSLV
jgi:hypothetical protein